MSSDSRRADAPRAEDRDGLVPPAANPPMMASADLANDPRTMERVEPKPVIAQGWLQALRARLGLPSAPTLRDTLEDALQSRDAAAAFSTEERGMLQRLLRFGQLRVEDVMVPRADIIALEEGVPLGEMLAGFDEAGVSRMPVYRETLDDPRGMIHIKDVVSWMRSEAAKPVQAAPPPAAVPARSPDRPPQGQVTPLPAPKVISAPRAPSPLPVSPPADGNHKARPSSLASLDLSRAVPVARFRRPVLFVPASMPAMNLLRRMQTTRIHMALVVDEYGGTDGLVTIEDLVEQIVGDIEDEHDEQEAEHISEDAKAGLVASARTPVAEVEKRLGLVLLTEEERDSIDTLGGFVVSLVGRVPGRGELIRHPAGLEFEVLDADARSIKRLRVHQNRPQPTAEGQTPAADGAVTLPTDAGQPFEQGARLA